MLKLTQIYCWKGLDPSGRHISGRKIGCQVDVLRAQLKGEGVLVTQLKKKWWIITTYANLGMQDISNFSRQLAYLLHSDFPLVTALDILASQYIANRSMQELLLDLKASLGAGISFSAALRQHPVYFSALYCHLMEVGEKCGNLKDPLLQISHYQEKLLAIKKNIYKALYYPMGLLGVAIGVIIFLVVFIMPQFEELFITVGANLPTLTRSMIASGRILKSHGLYFLISGCVLSIFIMLFRFRLLKWRAFFESMILRLPWVGSIIQQATLARVARTMSTTLAAGLPMVEALMAAQSAAKYQAYELAILKSRQAVIEGIPLEKALKSSQCFSGYFVQTVEIGQLSGRLSQHLGQLSDFLEANVNDSVLRMIHFLEPTLLLILGVLIGIFMLALYWPIFELGNAIGMV